MRRRSIRPRTSRPPMNGTPATLTPTRTPHERGTQVGLGGRGGLGDEATVGVRPHRRRGARGAADGHPGLAGVRRAVRRGPVDLRRDRVGVVGRRGRLRHVVVEQRLNGVPLEPLPGKAVLHGLRRQQTGEHPAERGERPATARSRPPARHCDAAADCAAIATATPSEPSDHGMPPSLASSSRPHGHATSPSHTGSVPAMLTTSPTTRAFQGSGHPSPAGASAGTRRRR